MGSEWTLNLGTMEDGERFIRERARLMSPEDGLTALEELRRVHYDDPENPPRLERVFVLFTGPRREVCGRGGLGFDGPGKAEFVKTKRATGRTKDKLDLELLREVLDERTLALAPFAPHLAEEVWQLRGKRELVAQSVSPRSRDGRP